MAHVRIVLGAALCDVWSRGLAEGAARSLLPGAWDPVRRPDLPGCRLLDLEGEGDPGCARTRTPHPDQGGARAHLLGEFSER